MTYRTLASTVDQGLYVFCHLILAGFAGPVPVGPQMEPLLCVIEKSARRCVSQAISGWCAQWKALVGLKDKGMGEVREALASASASGGCTGGSCQTSPQRPSFLR